VTCKRYYPEDGKIRLQPANAAMAPIYVHQAEGRAFEILGKVVGVYRSLHSTEALAGQAPARRVLRRC
jgi:repressor LexA